MLYFVEVTNVSRGEYKLVALTSLYSKDYKIISTNEKRDGKASNCFKDESSIVHYGRALEYSFT